jgi:hypothetical protein
MEISPSRISPKKHTMQKLLLLLILSISTIIAKAECVMGNVYCWPTKTTINRNSLFIIEFYGYSQKNVSEISKLNQLFLNSGNEKVHLKIVEVNKGEFELTQIILQPEKLLKSGLEYELIVGGLNKKGTISRQNPVTKKMENVKWLVNDKIDNEKPKWVSYPSFQSKTKMEFGCGPEKWVNFNFKSSDSSNILIKATVKSIKTNTETVYFIESFNNQIKIGHDMCSGAFHFDNGDDYEVTFSLVDQSGNFSKQTSKPIRFSKPTESSQTE